MSQGVTGGKGGNAPSGPQFNAAAAQSGQMGQPMSFQQFQQETGNNPMSQQLYQQYVQQFGQRYGTQDAAQAQGQSSQQVTGQQTTANRPDQTNAFGASSQWTLDPKTRQWTQNVGFGGPLAGGVGNLENQIANQGPLGTGDQARQNAISQITKAGMDVLNPRLQAQQQAVQTQLANQGLPIGSEAYNNAERELSNNQNTAIDQLLAQAQSQGTQAQQATFGENLAAQNNPYNQLAGLNGLSQMPGFAQAGAAQATQYLPAAIAQYAQQLQGYGIGQQGKNSTTGGLMNLGGTLGSAAIMGG